MMNLRAEKIIPGVRAVLARLLVEKYGLKKVEVARALGLSPQAVTQYLTGARAGDAAEMLKHQQVLTLIEDLAAKIAARGGQLMQAEIIDLAFEIASIIQSKPEEEKAEAIPTDVREKLLKTLRARLQAEQEAAELFMGVAAKMRNDLSRLLFRQIASDSIRHADIVMATISAIERGENTPVDFPEEKELKKLLENEETAHVHSLEDVRHLIQNDVIGLLIDSIEADEEKHAKILAKLISIKQQKKQ
ncbi:MAG: hypothetical protein NXY59_04430 [Aigarchaeota archaeon]|nr:hypothetical protein [Candidatus Pelearchaeum maunauluense]